MKTLSAVLVWSLFVVSASAADDAKKLIVGQWEGTHKGPENVEVKIEAKFTMDGKIEMTIRNIVIKGSYSFVDDKSILTKTTFDGKTIETRQTITVTQEVLELRDQQGQVFKFKRTVPK